MEKNNFRFFGIFALLVSILILSFVWANALAINVTFNQNASANYDEGGILFVNWTADATAAANYTVYLWMNNDFVNGTTNVNNSETGYVWGANITEANYTFTIEAVTIVNASATNATNVSMFVDSTEPLVNWTGSGYNNVTYKKNTDQLILNISVGDVISGVNSSNSYCVFDINGTNETVLVSGGWCNTTALNLTGLTTDGNKTIDIWANDTVNNVGVNLSYYVVWVDTTAPAVPTFSCTPSSLRVGDSFSCSCTSTDASSGINTSYGTDGYSFTASPSTATTGTFTETCTTEDYAGNSNSASLEYTVHEALSTGGTTTPPTWTHTYRPTDEQIEEGYTKELSVKNRVKVKVDGVDHHVGVSSLTATSATIEIASDPVQVTLDVGEDAKVDVTDDGFYDIYVLLNDIVNSKADVTIQKIHEEIPEGEGPVATAGEVAGEEEEEEEEEAERNLLWLWILIAVVVLVVIIGGGIAAKKKSK